jgi:cytochrome c oxidase assembly protein subunit 15
MQILIGGFVSGMDAGKIYNSWPLMNSFYFPDDNEIANLFNLRAFSEPSLVQFMHRNLAYIILLFYIFILIDIYKKKLTNFFYIINLLGVLLILQIILGIFTLLYDAQIILSSAHQTNSIFLVSASIYFLYLNSNTN